jgi:hypothetical protein
MFVSQDKNYLSAIPKIGWYPLGRLRLALRTFSPELIHRRLMCKKLGRTLVSPCDLELLEPPR